MRFEKFDRSLIEQKPLSERKNKVCIRDIYVKPDDLEPEIPEDQKEKIIKIAGYILDARSSGRNVMLSFGAHSIKNGLGPLMVEYLKKGWITHLATNGAGIIHDWEFAFQGKSSESVAENLPKGQFGTWEETGFFLNMTIIAGAYEGLGYGAGVGKAIDEQGIMIPSEDKFLEAIHGKSLDKAASAADFLAAIRKAGLEPGWKEIPTPYREFSLQAGAYRLGIALTGHPMFGHDIIYTHYLNCGDAIGRAAGKDFKTFVRSFKGLSGGGVYLSLGSAIMSPMLFQKANSIAPASGHHVVVVDLGEPKWDGIFKESSPSTMDLMITDNRIFLLTLYKELNKRTDDGR